MQPKAKQKYKMNKCVHHAKSIAKSLSKQRNKLALALIPSIQACTLGDTIAVLLKMGFYNNVRYRIDKAFQIFVKST